MLQVLQVCKLVGKTLPAFLSHYITMSHYKLLSLLSMSNMLHLCDYLQKISIKINLATDEDNSRNEM